jgi:putative DNA primase/helicase
MNAAELDVAFRRHMESFDLELPGEIICDGGLHRLGTKDKPRGLDGAYIGHLDPPASCWCMNHRTQESGTWTAKSTRELTPGEREALKRRIEHDRAARAKATAGLHAEKAALAGSIFEGAPACPDDHPYLVRKGVPALGDLRLARDGRIIVPVWNERGEIQSLQFIAEDGQKRFMTGGKMAGGYFPIKAPGDKTGPLYVCEGYATGATVHLATGATVLCAFNAGNLKAVAEMARRFYA